MINDYECAEPTEVLFQRCGGSKIMSTMDLTSSFWQIPLAEESKKYKAFLHEGRCYQFCVTSFGLKTSTAALVRALDFVLSGLGNFYLTFIDDIFCASQNVYQHLLHLKLLFHRLLENNLTINLEKSHFFRSEVKFLGHILTSTGIKPVPEKIEAIRNFSRPRNLKELRGFLGLINFYTKFSKKHAAKIVPILELLKKGVKLSWNNDLERVFNEIEFLFSSSILLNYPEVKKPFYLQTDSSDVTLYSVLVQLDEDGNPCPIIYASRTLKGAELAYYTTKKELLAIVWAVVNKLKKDHFAKHGKPSKIVTDHGTQFTSPVWSEFLKEQEIQPVFSSIRHPQSNIVERIYRELSRFFRSLIGDNHGSWWSWIKIIESCMNETYHETTEFTSIELHLNKRPKRAWENWLNFPQNSSKNIKRRR